MLNGMRTISLALAVLTAAAFAQTPAAGPQFEVASVKPTPSPTERRQQGLPNVSPMKVDPGRYEISTSLGNLMRSAYRLAYYQKVAGPDWLNTKWFEIKAKLPEGSNKEQIPEMVKALLIARFQLSAHVESEEASVYILTVGKDGPKLKDADPDAATNSKWTPNAGGRRTIVRTNTVNGWTSISDLNGIILFDANRIAFADLVPVIGHEVDLPVIDRTGLKGMYEVSMPIPGLTFRALLAARQTDSNAAADPAGADIFKSMEKLGLRLEKGKAPIERLVVDRVEKDPTGN